jgi:GTPase
MLPKVAIVGRPNVGKSSLLNMLAGKLISIVDPTAGVTRDRITVDVELPPGPKGEPRYCELIDTGGYGVYSGDARWESLTDDVERQIGLAVQEADIILFVVDAQSGVTPLDAQVAQLLRKRVVGASPVVLVANKVDDASHEAAAMGLMTLGFGEPVMVSATGKRGRHELLELMSERLGASAEQAPATSEMLLAIVGRRNAGKSTLVNTLAGAERVIASEIPGTTRDSVDVRFELEGRTFTAVDTAGVRKRKSMADDIEYYSLHRALRSIRRADVVVLLIDATEPVGQLEKHLGAEIIEHFKPCIIAVNKWDLVKDRLTTDQFMPYLGDVLRGLDFAPVAFISAKDNDNVRGLVKTASDLHGQAGQRIPTGRLNAVVQQILQQRGPSSKLGQQARIYYATMPSTSPPTITLFVNHPELFDATYQRYLVNQFRLHLPYVEVPIRLLIRGRRPRESGEDGQ